MNWFLKCPFLWGLGDFGFVWKWGLFQGFEDDGVGAVDDGGVEAGEVDLGGGFAVVAHAFAYDA